LVGLAAGDRSLDPGFYSHSDHGARCALVHMDVRNISEAASSLTPSTAGTEAIAVTQRRGMGRSDLM